MYCLFYGKNSYGNWCSWQVEVFSNLIFATNFWVNVLKSITQFICIHFLIALLFLTLTKLTHASSPIPLLFIWTLLTNLTCSVKLSPPQGQKFSLSFPKLATALSHKSSIFSHFVINNLRLQPHICLLLTKKKQNYWTNMIINRSINCSNCVYTAAK